MSPEGEIWQIDNLKEFCDKQGWSYRSLHPNVSRGHGKYKGWIVKKATLRPERVIEELIRSHTESKTAQDTVASIARENGLESSSVLYRMNKKGMSLEEALFDLKPELDEDFKIKEEIIEKIVSLSSKDLKKIKFFLDNLL